MHSENYLSERLTFKTLTPIFIGQDQSNTLSPYSDYVQVENEIWYIDKEKFEQALSEKEGLIDKYVTQIRRKIDKSGTRSDFSLDDFIRVNLGDVENYVKIKIPVDNNLKHTHIKRFILTSGRPFIPGSTIKGAVRTAIIYDWLTRSDTGKKVVDDIISKVNDVLNKISILEQKQNKSENDLKELEKISFVRKRETILNSIYDEQKLFGSVKNHDGFDSRHIQVSDSNTIDTVNLSVIKLHRVKVKDETEISPLPSETVNQNVKGNFDLKFEKSFNQQDLKKFNSFTIKDILKLLNSFSLASMKYELETFIKYQNEQNEKKTDYSSIIEFYEAMISAIEKSNAAYAIIRIGSGKTFYDNSIGMAILERDYEEFKKYRTFLELGKNPQSGDLVQGRFPTTRTLVEDTKLPIGWVAISSDPNSVESLDYYKSKRKEILAETQQPGKKQAEKKKPTYTSAEIIDDSSKPPKVKILDGKYKDKVTMLPGVNLTGLGLAAGSRVYVELSVDKKKNLQKAEYKGKAENDAGN